MKSSKMSKGRNASKEVANHCITVFTCAHQVWKYAYRMKQNVFNRFHILTYDHCQGYIQWCA